MQLFRKRILIWGCSMSWWKFHVFENLWQQCLSILKSSCLMARISRNLAYSNVIFGLSNSPNLSIFWRILKAYWETTFEKFRRTPLNSSKCSLRWGSGVGIKKRLWTIKTLTLLSSNLYYLRKSMSLAFASLLLSKHCFSYIGLAIWNLFFLFRSIVNHILW